MNNVLRVALVDPTDSTREKLKSTLLGMEVIWLEAECSRYEFFADVVGQTNPDIGIVSLDANPEKALALIEDLHDSNPECSILVVSASTDGNLILRAMRSGAKEFLTHPVVLEDLMAALERISNQKFGKGESRTRGCRVITVGGATGGVGATSLAVNLGCILAANEKNNVVLIDLDLALGDADVFLDTIPDYTLVDVAQNIQRLDFNLLKRSLTKHSSGLYLLPRPVQLHDDSLISPSDFSRVIGLLKATFTHLIIDLSKGFRPLDFVAMREAHDNLMVIQLDLPCLRNVVRLMMSFAETDGLKEKTRIVVNRVGLDSGQISLKKAQETIGSEIYWQIPNDYRVMVEVRNNGVPLIEQAPRAGITQAISSLADALSGESKKTATGGGKAGISRWFGFLGGGKQGEPQPSLEGDEETATK
ncbi:pilus assembly protein CpaE [Blastopirellula sp. JC732]|uniref:Pilus assembly protein CpaE n=1 Tax=Blastopirellula sediminis TaxID=2894196 RepID=A0A9X1MJY5_9BACT|nr:pilus assembly protein CpaE [Blastopirellula sediminis]MCC9609574.1 pilus assembly protein CpaE [Blastopirellula sediminis]MCC9627650.1 pilus assembly protein CpaE [Blastopirellula sediminis]